ncbi:MAG: DUF1700 domain-containing protein [Clostridium sp.]
MNRDEFLNIIKEGLKDFPEMELNDILYDYREHFDAALASGKSNEEIIRELGNPEDLVNQYRSGYIQKYEGPKNNNTYNDNTSSKSNTTNSSNDGFNYKTSKSSSSQDTTSQIIKILLVICALIFLGPIASGLIVGIIGLFVGFTGLFFGVTVGGIGMLLGTTFTSILGFITIPAFIAEFPTTVIVLFTVGGLLGFIFNLMIIYYLIKLFVRLVKKFINWVSPMMRGEK